MNKKTKTLGALLVMSASLLATSCDNNKNTVTIYTSTEDYNQAYLQKCLEEKFPKYKIVIENMGTSDIANKIIEEGADSDCDIVYAEEYGYLEKMIEKGVLDSIEGDYDLTRYSDDAVASNVNKYVLPNVRTGGGIILNTKVLADNGLAEPTSYADLLAPGYKNLLSMASPKSSGTGYMFLYSLVKAHGEEAALAYFDSFSENVLAYTKSGSGPVNALIQREVAVGFGMVSQAVTKINEGNNELKVVFFEEGAPCNLYGASIVKGKKEKKAVKDVMDYLDSFYVNSSCEKYYPEPVFKNTNYKIENFPESIAYANMDGNNLATKEALLAKWTH